MLMFVRFEDLPAPIVVRMPPISAGVMKIATRVPPSMVPMMADMINRIPGVRSFAHMETVPSMMVVKENRMPAHPKLTTVSAPSASKALPSPPKISVAPAANKAKIPAMRAMISPAFCMLPSYVDLLHVYVRQDKGEKEQRIRI